MVWTHSPSILSKIMRICKHLLRNWLDTGFKCRVRVLTLNSFRYFLLITENSEISDSLILGERVAGLLGFWRRGVFRECSFPARVTMNDYIILLSLLAELSLDDQSICAFVLETRSSLQVVADSQTQSLGLAIRNRIKEGNVSFSSAENLYV